jgi:hypothetical protein
MLLDLVDGKPDEILVGRRSQRGAQIVGIGWRSTPARARRRPEPATGLAGIDLGIEMASSQQKLVPS